MQSTSNDPNVLEVATGFNQQAIARPGGGSSSSQEAGFGGSVSSMPASSGPIAAAAATPFAPFATGLYLGTLQVSVYLTMQVFVTASFMGYFIVVLAWMVGAIITLKAPRPRSLRTAMAVSAAAFGGLVLLAPVTAGSILLLTVLALLAALSAFPAGTFFRVAGRRAGARFLLFNENNGFVLGYVAAIFAFIQTGQAALLWGPGLMFLVAVAAQGGYARIGYAGLCLTTAFTAVFLSSAPLFWTCLAVSALGGACLVLKARPRGSKHTEGSGAGPARQDGTSLPRPLLKLVLFLCGANLVLLQYAITREFSSILAASELTILIVGATYFAGFSVGYGVSRFLGMRGLRWATVAGLLLHIMALPFVKAAAGFLISSGYGMGVFIGLLFLTAFCTSALYSVFLPSFIERLGAGSLPSAYAWDLAGAATGIAVMFVLVPIGSHLILPVYFSILAVIALLLCWGTRWIGPAAVTGFAAIALFASSQQELSTLVTEDYYAARGYRNPRLLFSGNSFYHSIDVLDTFNDGKRTSPRARVSFINGVRYFSYRYDSRGRFSRASGLSEYTYFLAEVPARYLSERLGRKLRVLVLGCGSMYSLSRVSDWSESTTMVEIDPLVIESARQCWSHFNRHDRLENYEIVIDDAAHFLRTTDRQFDLIINDISAPYYLGTSLLHSRDFFSLVATRLTPEGIFSESTQGSPKPGRPDSQGMKILKGVADVYPGYRMIEVYGRPHRKKSGYLYASRGSLLSTHRLRDLLKRDRTSKGLRIHTPGCKHYDLGASEAISYDNLGRLIPGNYARMRSRLGIGKEARTKDGPRASMAIPWLQDRLSRTAFVLPAVLLLGLALLSFCMPSPATRRSLRRRAAGAASTGS